MLTGGVSRLQRICDTTRTARLDEAMVAPVVLPESCTEAGDGYFTCAEGIFFTRNQNTVLA